MTRIAYNDIVILLWRIEMGRHAKIQGKSEEISLRLATDIVEHLRKTARKMSSVRNSDMTMQDLIRDAISAAYPNKGNSNG